MLILAVAQLAAEKWYSKSKTRLIVNLRLCLQMIKWDRRYMLLITLFADP